MSRQYLTGPPKLSPEARMALADAKSDLTSCCGRQVVTWDEPSVLVVAPDWWPQNTPYNPPPQETSHKLCLNCGRHDVEVSV